ncbi:antitoxin YezG family protein [Microlunatus parietis]|uniref:DUF600 family protein n=1 Tax=Microlunatus parietis TaxID=682979 RepID=A0A7Y9LD88_9ACTN|nr:hypothetical protein [Microlunatus parietis]NYE72643.1 hypothetical protein [Microlunatus parietis]
MTPDPETLKRIASAMVEPAPKGWSRIQLFASAVASGNQTKLAIEKGDGNVDRSQGISADGHFAIGDLRAAMYAEGVGTWYNATFTLTPDGQLETDFDYDNPPYNGDYVDVMLEDDQEAYPRSPENLPAWHPSRT